MNNELQEHWDHATMLKTAHVTQQAEISRLQEELAKWKSQLARLQAMVDEGELTESQLHNELLAGLGTMCEQVGPQLGVAQQILMDCKVDLATHGAERVIGALSAKVELLNNQVRYWQDSTTGCGQFEETAANDSGPVPVVTASELEALVAPETNHKSNSGPASTRAAGSKHSLEERVVDAVKAVEQSTSSPTEHNPGPAEDRPAANDAKATSDSGSAAAAANPSGKTRSAKRTPRRRRRKGPLFSSGL